MVYVKSEVSLSVGSSWDSKILIPIGLVVGDKICRTAYASRRPVVRFRLACALSNRLF